MAGIRVIAKARDRIAKFREAKKMVRASGDAHRGSTRASPWTACAVNPFPVTENADRAPVRPHIERVL